MEPDGVADGKRQEQHLEREDAVGEQIACLRGEHQQARQRAKCSAKQNKWQRQAREVLKRDGRAEAEHSQVNKCEIAEDQCHAQQVQHFERWINPQA